MHAPNRLGTSLTYLHSCIITPGKDKDDSGQGSVSSRNIRERARRHQETEEQRELGLQARWNEVGSDDDKKTRSSNKTASKDKKGIDKKVQNTGNSALKHNNEATRRKSRTVATFLETQRRKQLEESC